MRNNPVSPAPFDRDHLFPCPRVLSMCLLYQYHIDFAREAICSKE